MLRCMFCLLTPTLLCTTISPHRKGDVARVRDSMKQLGIKKSPGKSWIEIDGKVHVFYVEDKTHPRTQEIYDYLNHIDKKIREAG